jgi:hypothetical protein
MKEQTETHHQPIAVDSELAALGLNRQILLAATTAGHEAAAATTLHHPKSHAGYVTWSEASKTIRDLLVPEGWIAEDVDGQPRVRNERRKVALTVSGADEWTGRIGEHDEQPRTRSKKGPVTLNAIKANSGWLFPELAADERERVQRQTWFLLIFPDEENQETRSELSLPVAIDDADHICRWSKRILLPAIPWGDEPTRISQPTPDQGPLSGVDTVEVRRKANAG